jgi:GTP-binding protein Era
MTSEPIGPGPDFRSGMVAILGKPNAGKSTLLNSVLGTKVAAVSALPQTTRTRLAGIHTDGRCQIVFIDLPGLVAPNDRLNTALRQNAIDGLDGADAVLHLIDAADPEPWSADVAEIVAAVRAPMVLAINKLDGRRAGADPLAVARAWPLPFTTTRYTGVVGISALNRTGMDALVEALRPHLHPGPPLYDPDQLVDAHLRDLASEMIREKAFHFLRDELPYAVAVEIEEFTERPAPQKWYIRAIVHVERDSQKGILIGEGGVTMKRLSAAARADIERLCEAPVFLELWVKVRKNWRKNEADLRAFGLAPRPKKKKR